MLSLRILQTMIPDVQMARRTGSRTTRTSRWMHVFFFLEDLYCLSRVSLNSLVFTIRWQLVERKPEPPLLPTQVIFNIPHNTDMVGEQLAFDDAVSYTQQWKSKLAEVMAWGIELLNFRLGVQHWTKSQTPLCHSATEDDTEDAYFVVPWFWSSVMFLK